jgi:transmembrane protein
MRAYAGHRSEAAPAPVVRWLDNPAMLLAARLCLVSPYLAAGAFKMLDWPAGVAEMAHVGLHPPWAFNLASLAVELSGSALIVFNRMTWLGAGALGVFTFIATFLAHRFWELDGEARITQFNTFLEHAAISAAFILVAVVSLRDR